METSSHVQNRVTGKDSMQAMVMVWLPPLSAAPRSGLGRRHAGQALRLAGAALLMTSMCSIIANVSTMIFSPIATLWITRTGVDS